MKLVCQKCDVPLEPGRVMVKYLDNAFPVELLRPGVRTGEPGRRQDAGCGESAGRQMRLWDGRQADARDL